MCELGLKEPSCVAVALLLAYIQSCDGVRGEIHDEYPGTLHNSTYRLAYLHLNRLISRLLCRRPTWRRPWMWLNCLLLSCHPAWRIEMYCRPQMHWCQKQARAYMLIRHATCRLPASTPQCCLRDRNAAELLILCGCAVVNSQHQGSRPVNR